MLATGRWLILEKERFGFKRSPVGSVIIGAITFAILYSFNYFAVGLALLVACAVAAASYFKPFYAPVILVASLVIPVYTLIPSDPAVAITPITALIMAFCIVLTLCFADWFGGLVGLWLGLSLCSSLAIIAAIPAIALLSAWSGMKKAAICSSVLAVFGFFFLNAYLFGFAVPQQFLNGGLFPNFASISTIPLAAFLLPYLFGTGWQQGLTSNIATAILNNSPIFFILVSLVLIPLSGCLSSFIRRRVNSFSLAALAAALTGTAVAASLYGTPDFLAVCCAALLICWAACAVSSPLMGNRSGMSADGILGMEKSSPLMETKGSNGDGIIVTRNPSKTFRGSNYWERVKGLSRVKRELLNSAIFPPPEGSRCNAEVHGTAKGILLFGPPGTGKITLLRGLASKLAVTYVEISPDALLRSGGDCGQKIRGAVQAAVYGPPSVFVIDGIDLISPRRQLPDEENDEAELLNELLKGVEVMSKSAADIIVVATASSCALDRSLLPPIFDSIICVPPPDAVMREAIFRLYLGDGLIDVDYGRLAKLSEGLTGGDIATLLTNVKSATFLNKILSSKEQKMDQQVLENAIRAAKPTVDQRTLGYMERFRREFRRERKTVNGCDLVQCVTFDEIGGLDAVKSALKETLALNFSGSDLVRDLGVSPPKSVLLYGPRGNGKTLLAEAVLSEVPANFFSIDGGALGAGSPPDGAAKIKDTFDLARSHLPAVVFLDEIGRVAPRSTLPPDLMSAQLFTELDSMRGTEGMMVLAASSCIQNVDPTLLDKFDKQLSVPMPDEAGRAKIFGIYLKGICTQDLSCDELAKMTEGFSALSIRELVESATNMISEGSISDPGRDWLTIADFKVAINAKKSIKEPIAALAQVAPTSLSLLPQVETSLAR